MIKINGKQYSKEKALALLEKAKRVTHFSFEIPRPASSNPEPKKLTDEGFTIDAEYLSSLCRAMRRTNATFARVTAASSGKLMGMDLVITLRDGKEPWLERVLRKLNLIS